MCNPIEFENIFLTIFSPMHCNALQWLSIKIIKKKRAGRREFYFEKISQFLIKYKYGNILYFDEEIMCACNNILEMHKVVEFFFDKKNQLK